MLWTLLFLGACLVLLGPLNPGTAVRPGFASALTSVPTGTVAPTSIGLPPGPPTLTPTATVPVTSTAAVGSPTPTSTPGATAKAQFSLDAVRVSKPNNKGDLSGLSSVRRGTTVWLMMYYTVRSMPRAATRTTQYEVDFNGRPIFKVAFRTAAKVTEVGHLSRYTIYTIPKSLPYGRYVYRASLAIGSRPKWKSWKFQVGKQEKVAKTGAA